MKAMLTTDDRGRLFTGSRDGDAALKRAIQNARILAADCGRPFFVWMHGVNGLSVHDRRPARPFVEVLPSGGTNFRARDYS